MAIWDIFKAKDERTSRVEGRIAELRVQKDDGDERWLIQLDNRPGEKFVFEPTPLSPLRRRGDEVEIVYAESAGADGAHPIEQMTSAA